MSFSSPVFLFWFLPIFLVLYYIVKPRLRSILLIAASFIFYAWGNIYQLAILIACILITWLCGRGIPKNRNFMWAGIAVNVAGLAFCKYSGLTALPLGMSFYTFHAISYLCDVARSECSGASLERLTLYLSMFPKVVMGPITPYSDMEASMDSLSPEIDGIADGMMRFSVGLAKKMLIAGQLTVFTSGCWEDAPYSVFSAWAGAIGYALQLYFDFSGYSDMAIGLGLMLGLKFSDNFSYPYTTTSVTQFWRCWHLSLGNWFKRYLYFPLGGSRLGTARTYLNLMIVWAVTGIWHGNGWNFLIWGLMLGVIICFEKAVNFQKRMPASLGWLWTCFFIAVGWVFFNSETAPDAIQYLGYMFGGAAHVISSVFVNSFNDYWYVLFAAALGATPVVKNTAEQIMKGSRSLPAVIIKTAVMLVLLTLSVYMLADSGYSAFIYTKF